MFFFQLLSLPTPALAFFTSDHVKQALFAQIKIRYSASAQRQLCYVALLKKVYTSHYLLVLHKFF